MHFAQHGSTTADPYASMGMQDSIREMNHRFLDLVATTSGWGGARRGMGINVSAQVAPLSATQKSAASNCPYALFDLRFHDAGHWRDRLREGQREWPVREWRVAEDLSVGQDTLEFVRLALFFAWHVAATTEFAAELLLGMSVGTAAAFRGVTIDCLPGLAATEAAYLTERWNDCPKYWQALTGAAAGRNAVDLRRIQLYGLQLAAAARLA